MKILNLIPKKREVDFVSFLLLLSLIPLSELIYYFNNEEYQKSIFIFLFGYFVFLIPIYLFRNNLKLYLKLLFPIFLIVPINLAYVLTFNSEISEASILMLMNTNKHEALELARAYFLLLAIFLVFYLILIYWLYSSSASSIPTKKAKYISLIALLILITAPFINYNQEKGYSTNLKDKLYLFFPGTLLQGMELIIYQQHFINRTAKARSQFSFSSKQDPSITDDQVQILIIGESSRYDHWGINGYFRDTNPHLSKRKNLISFSHTTTTGFMTEYAVPMVLTGVEPNNFKMHSKQKSIVSTFAEAGFSTYWISSQTDFGANIKMHSLEAQKGYYLLSDYRSTKNVHMDMELVDTLKDILAAPDHKKFIVLHTLGSHYNYSSRYPEEFDFFQPSNKTIESKITNIAYKDVLVNSYDNSILYTDAVLDSVISLVSALHCFSSVTYISDHGEDLFDDNRNRVDHNSGTPPSKYVAHIPFFIWYSTKMEELFPNQVLNLKKHKDSDISSENIIHTLTSMLGIHYPTQNPEKDISSDKFQNANQEILGEHDKVYQVSALR